MTILGWSESYSVSRNSTWHGSDQGYIPVLDMFALQLILASSRRFVEGSAWKNGEMYGKMGKCMEMEKCMEIG